MSTKINIVAAKRTPIGNFQGCFKNFSAPQLGARAIKSAIKQAALKSQLIDEVIIGCVLSAGLGQAPARQAAILAGLSHNVPATTINKMCGSGLKSVMLAYDALLTEEYNAIIAGGMESMTNTPYLLPKARAGYRLGHQKVIDHIFFDGLEDAYQKGQLMGVFAENCAQKFKLTREQQDKFAINSVKRAQEATQKQYFKSEIVAIDGITQDEGPNTAKLEKIPMLKPAFKENGTVTAANSSSISDGAAVLILMQESKMKENNLKPLAQILAHASAAQEPNWFTTAPIVAIKKLMNKLNWTINEVDLFEINEAFAVVAMAAMQELNIPPEKINVNGGGCVLGHPIGASGARILVTLIYALRQHKLNRGIAALCIGGGEAVAVAVEIK